MFKIKIPIFYLFLAVLIGLILTFIGVKLATKRQSDLDRNLVNQSNEASCNYKISRITSFKYTRPIISAEPECESPIFFPLKNALNSFIENEEKDGVVTSASVYIRDFEKGEWMAINEDRRYLPGSLLKVGILITWLRMSENQPGLLEKELVYHGARGFSFPIEHYKSDTVKEGNKYKVKELLESMIANSDNRATLFLENIMDTNIFKKEFSDLGIPQPSFTDNNFMLNVKDYSIFMKALFNSSYLNPKESEYAISLLTRSHFKEGLVKELPDSVLIAHKFGEAGDSRIHELHETGMIYINNRPYLITVMTQGYDWNRLAQVISHISRLTYDNMLSMTN